MKILSRLKEKSTISGILLLISVITGVHFDNDKIFEAVTVLVGVYEVIRKEHTKKDEKDK